MTDARFIKLITTGFLLVLATCPQAWAACPSGQTEDATTGHCIQSGNACDDNKCTYYYDTTTKDMIIKPNPGVEGEVKISSSFGRGRVVNNLTIDEGITGLGGFSLWSDAAGFGTRNGILKLPSTLTSAEVLSIYATGFGTVDVSAVKNFQGALNIGSPSTKTLIIAEDSSVMNLTHSYDSYPTDVTIQCKGNLEMCQQKVRRVSSNTKLAFDYYIGYDDNGNIIEEWDAKGKHEYSYKIDGAGNITAAYKDGVATYKRTSYTPAEASAALKKGNDNKITFTFK